MEASGTEFLFSEPINIRYEGLDADSHQIDLHLLGASLQSAGRLLAVAGHLAVHGQYVKRVPSLDVRVRAGIPQHGCYEVPVHLLSTTTLLPLLSAEARELVRKAIVAITSIIFAENAGDQKEAAKQMEHLVEINRQNAEALARSMGTVDRAVDVVREVSLAALGERRACQGFAQPIGPSVHAAMIGSRREALVVDEHVRRQFEAKDLEEVDRHAKRYTVQLSGLDVETGACKLLLHGSERQDRIEGKIADPVVSEARNPYSSALDSQEWIEVQAKAHRRSGEIYKLTILDVVSSEDKDGSLW